MDKFLVTLPLTGEYLTTVRLTTGGICALADFDVESTEDFKVCVTESLLVLKRNGFSTATIEFTLSDMLCCCVRGEGVCGEKTESMEEEISRALLSALLGKIEFVTNEDDRVEKIVFEG